MQLLNRGNSTTVRTAARGVEVNKVLRNTYALLSVTLLFSAITAALSMVNQWPHPGLIITLVGYFGLLFLAGRFRNSALGIVFVFALTGFMGLTLGPIISFYLTALPNGGQIVMTAMGGTGIIFVGTLSLRADHPKGFQLPRWNAVCRNSGRFSRGSGCDHIQYSRSVYGSVGHVHSVDERSYLVSDQSNHPWR